MLGRGLESLIPPSEPEDEKKPEIIELPISPVQETTFPIPSPQTVSLKPPITPSAPVPAVPPATLPTPIPDVGLSAGGVPLASIPKIREDERDFKNLYQAIFQIEVEKIAPNPHQPRKEFDQASLQELAQSIREFGILQPLVVTKIEKETQTGIEVSYELIAGERRLMAAKILGLERVPAIIRMVDTERSRLEMAIIENIQRENLNPIEMARAFSRLQDEFRLTQREIASRLGKSREVVANTLRLLDAPSYMQDAVSKGNISESHARLLLAVTDKEAQEQLFRDLLDRHFTTRELRMKIGFATKKPEDRIEATPHLVISSEILALEEKLSAELGTPVKISQTESGGRITISFYSPEELKHLLERLER